MLQPSHPELPHGASFQFVGPIVGFHPREGLEAQLDTSRLPPLLRPSSFVPEACILEGMAQAAVIWFARTVAPLQPWETPVLGYLAFDFMRPAAWNEPVRLRIRPLRSLGDRAVFEASAMGRDGLIARGQLAVARTTTAAAGSLTACTEPPAAAP